MKQIFLCLAVSLWLFACNNEKKPEAVAGDSSTKASVNLPYAASYSSSFEIGDPAHSATILQGSWKDWELNKMENMKSWAADTVVVYLSDASVVRGVDSLQARWTRNRTAYTAVIDTISAVVPLRSTDKNQNWVLVWATEINTMPNGTKDTVYLMETWRMNKDGKADVLYQYDRHVRKK